MDKITVKVSRNIGLKTGVSAMGVNEYDNIFFNLDDKEGTAIELTEKEVKRIRSANTAFTNAQKLLEKKWEGK